MAGTWYDKQICGAVGSGNCLAAPNHEQGVSLHMAIRNSTHLNFIRKPISIFFIVRHSCALLRLIAAVRGPAAPVAKPDRSGSATSHRKD